MSFLDSVNWKSILRIESRLGSGRFISRFPSSMSMWHGGVLERCAPYTIGFLDAAMWPMSPTISPEVPLFATNN